MNLKLKVKNYQCFGKTFQGFEKLLPLNIIIGKNNSGKSALLDIFDAYFFSSNFKRVKEHTEIYIEQPGASEIIESFFQKMSGFPNDRSRLQSYFETNPDATISWTDRSGSLEFQSLNPSIEFSNDFGLHFTKYIKEHRRPLRGYSYARLRADRDLVPEKRDLGEDLSENGRGASYLMYKHFVKATQKDALLIDKITADLNFIFQPESHFNQIKVLEHDGSDSLVEIFLQEDNKGLVPLSQSGSGLKTILLVLMYFYAVPFERRGNKKFIFSFEEIENNLHPALIRKLFFYIYNKAKAEGHIVFVTTHSSIAIDLFRNADDVQFLHTTHDKNCSEVRSISDYLQHSTVLDDIGIRPSDILQSNCIVWVEGPSDRIFFNKWIELFTSSTLKEGLHYQCLFYGGSLLAHHSASPPLDEESTTDFIHVLNVNRNAIFLMDSDRNEERGELAQRKTRIIEAIMKPDHNRGLAWVTNGREIENYIPQKILDDFFGKSEPLQKYEKITTWLERIKTGLGTNYDKVQRARDFAEKFSLDDLLKCYDLKERLEEVTKQIRKWNGL